MPQGAVRPELGMFGGEIGKKVTEGPVLPTGLGTHIAHSLEESSLGPTNQAGGKWEVGTKLQMSFQTSSRSHEEIGHPPRNWEPSALTAGPQF